MRIVLIVVIHLLALGQAGCVRPIADLYPPAKADTNIPIYLVGHGWHAGVVVPISAVATNVWPETADFVTNTYLEVGWGDEEFYRAPKATAGLAIKALLRPTRSVLHVVGFDKPVDRYFTESEIIQIDLSEKGFDALCRFVSNAYHRDENGRTRSLGPGIYGYSRFYKAVEMYYFPKTCNVWTARAIRSAGCPITPIYAITSGNVMYQARKFGEPCARPAAESGDSCLGR